MFIISNLCRIAAGLRSACPLLRCPPFYCDRKIRHNLLNMNVSLLRRKDEEDELQTDLYRYRRYAVK